jgi:hypothetical protein
MVLIFSLHSNPNMKYVVLGGGSSSFDVYIIVYLLSRGFHCSKQRVRVKLNISKGWRAIVTFVTYSGVVRD